MKDSNLPGTEVRRPEPALWDLRASRYALAGLILGVVFPLVAMFVKVAELGLPATVDNMIAVQQTEQLLWIIDTAPIILALLAGFAGRRQDALLRTNVEMQKEEEELNSIRSGLEQSIAERTHELDERNAQMRSIISFTRQIAELQDLTLVLSKAVEIATELFRHDRVDIFLVDNNGREAVLRSSSAPEGIRLIEQGYRLAVGDDSPVGRVAERGRTFVAPTRPGEGPAGSANSPTLASQITLPLITHGKVIGVLDVHSKQPGAFGRDQTDVLQLLADQLAAAIDSARLLTTSQETLRQLEQIGARQARATWQRFVSNRRVAYQFTPAGVRPIAPASRLADEKGLQVPLLLRGDEIGSLILQRKPGATWTETEQDLVQKVATQVALALDNGRLLEETRQRAAQEQTVNEISARLSRSLDVDTLLQTAVRELAALPEIAEASVVIAPPNSNGRKP